MHCVMTNREQAFSLVDKLKIVEYFKFMQVQVGTNAMLSQLQQEFAVGKASFDFYERLKTLADMLLPTDTDKVYKIIGTRNNKLVLQTGNQEQELPLDWNALQTELGRQGITSFQYAEKIYNIGEIGTANFNVLEQQLPHISRRFLTNPPFTRQFIGRTKELDEVHALLEADKPTLLVNGLGGIGKTSLARKYVEQFGDGYQHIVWLEQNSTLISALGSEFTLLENLHIKLSGQETELDRFKMVINRLTHLEGNNLLVVDNYTKTEADQAEKILKTFPFAKHWKILFTSREHIGLFETVQLDVLPEADAIALFKLYVKHKPINETELKELLTEVGYHTLTIELLAKNYEESWDLESIGEITIILKDRSVDDSVFQKLIPSGAVYTEYLHSHEDILKICRESMDKLHHNYPSVLNNLAVLYSKKDKYEYSLALYKEYLETQKNTLNNQNPRDIVTLFNFGELLLNIGQVETGLKYCLTSYRALYKTKYQIELHTKVLEVWKKFIELFLKDVPEKSLKESIIKSIEDNFILKNSDIYQISQLYREQTENKSGNTIKILFLWSCPAGVIPIKAIEECHYIRTSVQNVCHIIHVIERSNIDKKDFKDSIANENPYILHFSGHGTSGRISGIILQNDVKNGYEIFETHQVEVLFRRIKHKNNTKVVIFNACNSQEQANVICEYVPYVIGTNTNIQDEHAIAFSRGFYSQLAINIENIEDAYYEGVTMACIKGANETDFTLYKKG